MLNENNMTYKCPNCGGTLVFDIKTQKVVCQECHWVCQPNAS